MPETRTAKLFRNGASQAVRLPAEFRFEGNEVYATRDEQTGDVVLSKRPGARAWHEFFALMRTMHILDTDTASFVIRGRSPAVEARLAEIPPDRVCMSAVTRAELMYGLKRL